MSDIKAGNVVCLKSGSPKMTVELVDDNHIHCIWSDKSDEIKRGEFYLETLEVLNL